MNISKNDFVKIEYTGTITETKQVFDTTHKDVAQKEKIYNPKMSYGPIIICVGEKQIIPGLDEELEGKEEGKTYHLKIPSEKAFGKKDPKLLKLIPQNVFLKNQIRPMVGLEVTLENSPGIIRSVTAGRVYVDFNHPLAGKDLSYEVKILEKITDEKTKAESLFKIMLNQPSPKIEITNGQLKVKEYLHPQFHGIIKAKILQLIPAIKEVIFELEEKKQHKN